MSNVDHLVEVIDRQGDTLNRQGELLVALRKERVAQKNIIDLQSFQLADRDRVIARLLDGWTVDTVEEPQWRRSVWPNGHASSSMFEPMSDGEAAIIRQHQEKT